MSHMIELVRATLLQRVDSYSFTGVTTHTGIDITIILETIKLKGG